MGDAVQPEKLGRWDGLRRYGGDADGTQSRKSAEPFVQKAKAVVDLDSDLFQEE